MAEAGDPHASVRSRTFSDVLGAGGLRTLFQPIVHMETGAVAAYEALTRGPEGPYEQPDALFAAARADGLLARLDAACRVSAFQEASRLGITDPRTVFINVEPEAIDAATLRDLAAIALDAPGGLRVVLEFTERALGARPNELLRAAEQVRELGWKVALDDIGADPASLAFMSLLRPDVVKLDLSVVQGLPSPAVAEIMHAVNAYAERSGAVILAEGIETEAHGASARALGATLGQGWLYGRPVADPVPHGPEHRLRLDVEHVATSLLVDASPFACLPPDASVARSAKPLLVELSKHLEREAARLGPTCVVVSAFQHKRYFTEHTSTRYARLATEVGFVCALGEDLDVEPVRGVRGATLRPDDPVRGEWDIVVLSPHFSTALLARDLRHDAPEPLRMFDYALTYHRPTVIRAAHALLARVEPAVR